jgi:WD40 repeat protein
VAVSADGRRAVSCSDDTTVATWDLPGGMELHMMRGHTASVKSVAMSGDGRIAVSGAADHTVRVWDVPSGKCLRSLIGRTDEVASMALSDDGRIALSVSADKSMRVWDIATAACVRTVEDLPVDRWYHGHVVLSTDGHTAIIAAGRGDEKVFGVFDTTSGSFLRQLSDPQTRNNGLTDVTVSPDAHIAASLDDEGNLPVWDVISGGCLRRCRVGRAKESVGISADAKLPVIGGGFPRPVEAWTMGRWILRPLLGATPRTS